ncbi:MAG TPA: outer membrane lipoprotein carrier protein LolA [Myxococcota bacterium]|nr:outer membrane lipoprotein carrier protein LolA [Myxococcota bacterium]
MSLRRTAAAAAAALALAAARMAAAEDMKLDDLLAHMATTKGVVAEFREIKTLKLLDSPLETRGTVYFEPPDRFARVTREPAPTRLVLDGDRMHFQDATGGGDVDLSENPVARAMAENVIVLWQGDKNALEALYTLDFHADGSKWKLVLSPRHSPLDHFLRSITLSGDGSIMRQMEVLESDGDKTQTLFEKSDVEHQFGEEEARAIFGGPAPSAPAPPPGGGTK